MDLEKNICKIFILLLVSTFLWACSSNDKETISSSSNQLTTVEISSTVNDTPIAYTFEDGTTITKEELLSPVRLYDTICSTGNSQYFNKVYPVEVLDFLVKSSNQETSSDYATMLFDLYKQIYGDNFTLTNEFIQCEPLTEKELENFSEFYSQNLNLDITPEYAFIVTSDFTITYTDEDNSSATDNDLDYYICYFFNNNMYLDYLYIDTLDL